MAEAPTNPRSLTCSISMEQLAEIVHAYRLAHYSQQRQALKMSFTGPIPTLVFRRVMKEALFLGLIALMAYMLYEIVNMVLHSNVLPLALRRQVVPRAIWLDGAIVAIVGAILIRWGFRRNRQRFERTNVRDQLRSLPTTSAWTGLLSIDFTPAGICRRTQDGVLLLYWHEVASMHVVNGHLLFHERQWLAPFALPLSAIGDAQQQENLMTFCNQSMEQHGGGLAGFALRRFAAEHHRCRCCGYDLHGSRSVLCSECGYDCTELFHAEYT